MPTDTLPATSSATASDPHPRSWIRRVRLLPVAATTWGVAILTTTLPQTARPIALCAWGPRWCCSP